MVRIVARNRDPYMTDQPRPRLVEQREGLPGRDSPSISIAAAPVIAELAPEPVPVPEPELEVAVNATDPAAPQLPG